MKISMEHCGPSIKFMVKVLLQEISFLDVQAFELTQEVTKDFLILPPQPRSPGELKNIEIIQ